MDPESIENALEKKCEKHPYWLMWILLLATSPSIFVSSQAISYVFLGGNPSFFCNVPELVEANWTKQQIREISSSGLEKQSCVHYAWNYSALKDFGFDEALKYCNGRQKPNLIKCESYIYEEEIFHKSITSEWDLVCDDLPLRSTVQGSVALGKVFGAVTIGLLSDRFGRKKMFVLSCMVFMTATLSAGIVSSYIWFIVFRMMIGFSGVGVYETAYTILLELTVKNYRTYVTNIFNVGFSCGLLLLSLLAYLTTTWRQLQLTISALTTTLLIHCWFLPESPRWLITSGKLKKASNIIGSEWALVCEDPDQSKNRRFKRRSNSCQNNCFSFFKDYFKLFSTRELTKRILVCYYLWFMGNLYHFVIALSGSILDVNQYIYVSMVGIGEVPGYLLPVLVLSYYSRKSSSIALCVAAGAAMLLTALLPQGWPVICVSLAGRFLVTSAYGIIMFHTTELFPTENRNTAVGSCLTVSQLGPLLAPYLVDILGSRERWLPAVLCGSLTIAGAVLVTFLPETRGTQLLDTIEEMKQQERKSIEMTS